MRRLAELAALFLLASSCTSLSDRTEPRQQPPPDFDGAVEGPRPHGLDRWYRPQWGPPYTVSGGYAWVYEPCR
jgi:hypothetical protein